MEQRHRVIEGRLCSARTRDRESHFAEFVWDGVLMLGERRRGAPRGQCEEQHTEDGEFVDCRHSECKVTTGCCRASCAG